MVVYAISGGMIFLAAFACRFSNKNADKLFLFFAGAILFLVSALRATTVGTDLKNYLLIYDRIGEITMEEVPNLDTLYPGLNYTEKGFHYFCKILTYFSKDPGFFISVTSFIIVGGAIFQIYHFSNNYYFSILIYLLFGHYMESMNIIRVSMAMSILGIALFFLIKKKTVWYFIFVMLAICIHKTTMVFLMLYPLSKMKVNRKYFFLVLAGGLFIYKFGYDILLYAATFFHYDYYIKHIGHGNADGLLLMILIVCFATAFFWKSYEKDDPNAEIWVHTMSGAFLLAVSAIHFGLMSRAVFIFSFYISILVPNVIHSLKKINRVWGYSLVSFAMTFYAVYYLYRLDDINSNVFPYMFRI